MNDQLLRPAAPLSRLRALPPLPTLLLTLAVLALPMALHGPVAQPAAYHAFADARAWLGIPRAADVLSNLALLLAGLAGLLALARRPGSGPARPAYACFFLALMLTAAGSAWYHLAPDDARLVWDRLPIALASAALCTAVWRDTAGPGRRLGPLLALAAAASVVWWRRTGLHGAGDLRPYLLLQLLPLTLLPLLQWQHASARRARLAVGAAALLYLLAKVCEAADHALFDATGGLGGHALKHLLAAAAAAAMIAALPARDATRRGP